MGFFADLAREDYDRTYTDSELVRRLAIYFRHHGKKLTSHAGGDAYSGGRRCIVAGSCLIWGRAARRRSTEFAAVPDCSGSLRP